jgi:flagellar motor switch/type III secretory pathway protein FliN
MTRAGDSMADSRRIRPIKWGAHGPAARLGDAIKRPQAPVDLPWFDGAAFLGQFAPELSRLIGVRVSLRPAPAPDGSAPVRLVRLFEARTGAGGVALDLDRTTVCLLLEKMFGGAVEAGPPTRDVLSLLSPAAASWRSLSSCVSQAFRAGLGAALGGAPPSPEPVARIAETPVEGPHVRLWYALSVEGVAGWLALACRDPAAVPDAASAPGTGAGTADTPAAWADRAARMVGTIDLPVGVRLCELRLPLATILSLGPGSILPIERPRELVLIVDGKPWRHFDAAALAAPEQEIAP